MISKRAGDLEAMTFELHFELTRFDTKFIVFATIKAPNWYLLMQPVLKKTPILKLSNRQVEQMLSCGPLNKYLIRI